MKKTRVNPAFIKIYRDQKLFTQQFIDLGHHRKGIVHVQNIGFAARPSAVGIHVHGTALFDEAPAHYMRLLTVTAGSQSLGMTRGTAGLTNLIQVRHETEYRVPFAGHIHQRLGTAQGCLRFVQELQDD